MKAFVFINVSPGESTRVARELRKLEGVELAEPCWGLPDIIALVEVGNLQTLQQFILKEAQKISGVTQTDTHIVWEG
jgi:DNA-binding Lrp family transcriptional regulator